MCKSAQVWTTTQKLVRWRRRVRHAFVWKRYRGQIDAGEPVSPPGGVHIGSAVQLFGIRSRPLPPLTSKARRWVVFPRCKTAVILFVASAAAVSWAWTLPGHRLVSPAHAAELNALFNPPGARAMLFPFRVFPARTAGAPGTQIGTCSSTPPWTDRGPSTLCACGASPKFVPCATRSRPIRAVRAISRRRHLRLEPERGARAG